MSELVAGVFLGGGGKQKDRQRNQNEVQVAEGFT